MRSGRELPRLPGETTTLSAFIRSHKDEIVADWEQTVRGLPSAHDLSRPALIDHVPKLLDRIAEIAEQLASGAAPRLPDDLAELHALERLDEGFDLGQVVAEYAILRDCTLRAWAAHIEVGQQAYSDIAVMQNAIDRAVSASVKHFTVARDRTMNALDMISAAALETRSLDEFLARVLRVLLETTESVDTATIFLRDGDTLHVRATVGLEEELSRGWALRMGEGFAGMIAQTGKMHAIEHAAADPIVLSESLRASGVKALIGLPLVEQGRVIGVAYMGSLTAKHFSSQDQRIFAAMANRVTAAITMHVLRDASERSARQQRLVAALGLQALGSSDLDALFAAVVEGVRETLSAGFASIFELETSELLVLRAEAGWGRELVGALRIPASDHDSLAAVALHSGEPVIVDDVETETRLSIPAVVRDRGIRSGMSVPIKLPGGGTTAFGVLNAHADRVRGFSADDALFMQTVGNIVANAIAFRRAQSALEESVSQQRIAHAEAARSLAVLDTVLSASAVGIAFLDTELRYARVNSTLAALNGLPAEQHIGRTVREVLGAPADFLEPLLSKIIATREPVEDLELDLMGRSFVVNFVPVVTAAGELLGIGAVIIEVTERKRTTEALRISEARLQAILEHAPAAIFVKDAAGRLALVNRQVSTLMGKPVDELLGRTAYDLGPKHVADVITASDRAAVESGTAVHGEDAHEFQGDSRTYLTTKFPLPGPHGEVHLGAISIDITDRKRMELDLRERELQFRSIADNIPQLAWMADATGGIDWYNRRWYEYTGTTFEEMQGWGWRAAHHPEHLERVIVKFRDHIASGEVWEDTFPLRGADGRYRWFLSRAVPIRDDSGRVVRWFGTNTDVTEQRFMHEATALLSTSLDYRETLERVAQLAVPALGDWCAVDIVDDGVVSRVAVAHADPAKARLVREITERFPPDPNVPNGVPHVIKTGTTETVTDIPDELLAGRIQDPEQLRIVRELGLKSYAIVPIVARDRTLGAISLVSAESGRRYAASNVAMVEELGRRAGLAIDNARLFEETQRETRMREEILAVVSHDLKNPLGAVHLAAAVLLQEPNPKTRRHIETIQRSASRMDSLITDLLDMASIQAGRLAVERKAEDPDLLLREALEANEPMAREKGVDLARRGDVGSVKVCADRERILQVFGNLIGNAIKFCRAGESITMSGERHGDIVQFSVADTGPGIADAELPHIFEPYWSAKKYAKKGTGLGLYISMGIIEAHGGRIWVESTLGAGTTFHFTIPLA